MRAWRRRGVGRTILVLFLVLLAGAVACYAWLSRDPGSTFQERHGHLTDVQESPSGEDSLFARSWLTLRSDGGLVVECGMLTPRTSAGARHPAIIVLGGKATGKHAVDYALDISNVIIVAPDYPFTARTSYTPGEFLSDVPMIRQGLLDMVPSVMLVTDYLFGRADVDTTKVVLIGYSFGAPLVPCLVAHDRRPAAAVMVYGGGDVGDLVRHNVRRTEGPVLAAAAGALAALLLRPLEPMRYIEQVSPTPLIMINGEADEQIPRANADMLYRAAKEPKVQVWLPSRHVRPDNVALTRAIVAALKQELYRVLGRFDR